MQLDLFSDNRRTIRLNDAGDMLRFLDLEKALAVYADLLDDAPGDRTILHLQSTVREWRDALFRFHGLPKGNGRLHDLWLNLTEDTPPLLAAGVLELLTAEMKGLPSPELIYISPCFHLGTILMAKERFAEAEFWFTSALNSGIGERARFLGWRGDALTLLGDAGRARESYLAAFLEGPHSVDLTSTKNRMIHNLLFSLEIEGVDEIAEEDMVCWLPVWGWLHGVFVLSLDEVAADRDAFVASLERAEWLRDITAPRIWFEFLRYAEYLRTMFRNDREMVRVRRRMRDMCGFMFDRYMEKVRGL
jgi:tetratricopeptide (TPR) repeat protein